MTTRLIIPARLSYANIWEPRSIKGSDPKYSVSLIIDKSDTKTIRVIEKAIEEAIEVGSAKLGKNIKRSTLKLPLRDGDEERDDEAYQDSYFINANSKTAPGIVDRRARPILDRDEVYSGCYANVSVNFYAFNAEGSKGVACGLGNIQKVRDGDRIDGHISAENEFSAIDEDVDDEPDFLS